MYQTSSYSRSEPRLPAKGPATMTWDAGNGSRESQVEVRNISSAGVQVVSKRPLQPGWTAYLTGEQFECLGEVEYCVSVDVGFYVGMSFRREPYFRNAVGGPI